MDSVKIPIASQPQFLSLAHFLMEQSKKLCKRGNLQLVILADTVEIKSIRSPINPDAFYQSFFSANRIINVLTPVKGSFITFHIQQEWEKFLSSLSYTFLQIQSIITEETKPLNVPPKKKIIPSPLDSPLPVLEEVLEAGILIKELQQQEWEKFLSSLSYISPELESIITEETKALNRSPRTSMTPSSPDSPLPVLEDVLVSGILIEELH